jgi:hypothetical protein
MPEGALRCVWHEVAVCPRCGSPHSFPVRVRPRPSSAPVALFGGGALSSPTLGFTCPKTSEIVSISVSDPPDGEIIGPASPDDPILQSPDDTPVSAHSAESEYAEWIKASRATAIDFCKLMLTTSMGAIPVYFAVMKYVGFETATTSWTSLTIVAPPLLFLLAVLTFSSALRPRFVEIEQINFSEFRAVRLKRLDYLMLAGLAILSIGILLSIALAVGFVMHLTA